jgi:hypothetical protein
MVTDGCLLSLSETHVDITGDGEPKYVQVDLGAVKKIAEIRVWHYHADERTYNNTKTEVSKDGVAWETVFDSATKGTYKETATGHRISFDTKEVRYVRDWVNGSDKNQSNHWVEIQILSPFKEGILIEEGTTNLIPADKQKFVGWRAYSGATVTLTQNQTVSEWNTATATRIKTSGGSHRTKYFYPVLGPSVNGVLYSASVKINNIGSKPLVVDCNLPNSSKVIQPGEIKTVKATATGNGVSAFQFTFNTLHNAISDSLDFIAYQPMVETKPYATSWTDGTRAGESLNIAPDAINLSEGEIELTVIPQITPTIKANIHFEANAGTANKNQIQIWNERATPTDDTVFWKIGIMDKYGANRRINVPYNGQVGVPTDIKLKWKNVNSGQANAEVQVIINGKPLSSEYPVRNARIDMDPLTLAYIGRRATIGDFYGNAVYENLRVSNRYRSDEEDIAAYQSGKPLPVDEYTTAKMNFDGHINVTNGGFVWMSDKKDMTNVQDTETGKIEVKVNTPGESSVAIQTRSSADGVAWDDWQPVYGDGTIQSIHNGYMQVKAVGHGTETDKPSVQEIILSYDGSPTATELDTGLSPGGQWYFATLLSKCVMTNKLDPPKVWDGNKPIEILKGSPPHAQYITAHKNYLFMAGSSEGPSRLYFSEVLNIESWPVLNFIDVSPNDGDWITGLLPYDDYLIITKNRSVWLLVGSGPSDFEVRRIHDGIGCVAPRSLVRVVDSFAFASTEGIYLSDISTPTLISERLKETWKKMNRRRLHQIAGEFYDHKLRMDLPFGSSTVNNIRIIYDSIRKCLYLQEMSAHASCYAKYSEAGQEVLLFGHAGNGQVSHADTGTSDAGQPITMEWGTKHFNFGSSAIVKKARNLYFVTIPPSAPVEVQVYLIVDGEEMPTPLVFTVEPGKTVYKLKPRNIGVRNMRSLGYRIVVSETSGGVRFHELIQEYLMKKVKPS